MLTCLRRSNTGKLACPRFQPRLELLEARVMLSAGDLDPTFGTGGKVLTDFERPIAVTPRSDIDASTRRCSCVNRG